MQSGPTERNRPLVLVCASLDAGGAERVIATMANHWAARERRVVLVTLAPATRDRYPLLPQVERIGLDLQRPSLGLFTKVIANLARLWALRRHILGLRPAVVISFVDQMNVSVLAATKWSGVPVVVSERIDPRHHDVPRVWRALRTLLYPGASAVVVQTSAVAAWMTSFVAKERVHTVANPLRALPPPDETPAPGKTILAMGRLHHQKGFDLLLRAFHASGLAATDWRLCILGDGPDRESLRHLASDLGIADRLDLPGIVADPENRMRLGAIFVLSSRYEGFPNALLEALAMGMAVIATDCPSGPAEIVQHGKNGLLIRSGSIDELAAALRELASDEARRQRFGRAALDVRRRYDVNAVMAEWDRLVATALT